MARRPEIAEYDDGWRTAFDAIAAAIHDALGSTALRIDHIGSTAVPGLCAKNVIDVQVTVADLQTEVITPVLEKIGFRNHPTIDRDHVPSGSRGVDEEWRKLYFGTDDDTAHIHVRPSGRLNQRYALLFRDYLRAHPDAAAAYGAFKRRLAPLCADTLTYATAKDPVCDIIMSAAEDWAGRTGWSVSDPNGRAIH